MGFEAGDAVIGGLRTQTDRIVVVVRGVASDQFDGSCVTVDAGYTVDDDLGMVERLVEGDLSRVGNRRPSNHTAGFMLDEVVRGVAHHGRAGVDGRLVFEVANKRETHIPGTENQSTHDCLVGRERKGGDGSRGRGIRRLAARSEQRLGPVEYLGGAVDAPHAGFDTAVRDGFLDAVDMLLDRVNVGARAGVGREADRHTLLVPRFTDDIEGSDGA